MHEGRRWISAREFSVLFGFSGSKSVYALIGRGKIPAVRIGRLLRVDLVAFEKQLEAQAAAGRGRKR